MQGQLYKIVILLLGLTSLTQPANAQTNTSTLKVDATPNQTARTAQTVFTLEEFLTSVQLYHPIAQRAGLLTDRARAELLLARGLLDPQLSADWSQKNFDDKLYYQIYSGKLKVPTALGIDVVAGYEQTDGIFLNPENTTDEMGLWNVGIEADIFQGLIVNERRIALDRAEVIQRLNENQRQLEVNDLLYDAGLAYVDWQQYYNYGQVLDSNVVLAENYFTITKLSYEGGEYTAMDTLEAYISYQDALTERQKNEAMLIKARQNMENYLWYEGTPLELVPGISAPAFDVSVPFLNIAPVTTVAAANPLLRTYLNQQEIFVIEQRLKRVKARPKMKVKYNPLLATREESIRPTFNSNDLKWGFDFEMPLFLRSARAEIQLGELKIQEYGYLIQAKQNELTNKLQASINQIEVMRDQVRITTENVDRYELLLEGERIKFQFGESSVFLLNKRQEKFIESQLKLIELKAKIRGEVLNYGYLSNDLISQ